MKRFYFTAALLACAAMQACSSSRSNAYGPADGQAFENEVPTETASSWDSRRADAHHVHGGACGHHYSAGRWYFDAEHQYPVGE